MGGFYPEKALSVEIRRGALNDNVEMRKLL
jgi:hypothetical protein